MGRFLHLGQFDAGQYPPGAELTLSQITELFRQLFAHAADEATRQLLANRHVGMAQRLDVLLPDNSNFYHARLGVSSSGGGSILLLRVGENSWRVLSSSAGPAHATPEEQAPYIPEPIAPPPAAVITPVLPPAAAEAPAPTLGPTQTLPPSPVEQMIQTMWRQPPAPVAAPAAPSPLPWLEQESWGVKNSWLALGAAFLLVWVWSQYPSGGRK